MKTLILGGGLAGLSCSYHLGHQNCQIIEKNPYLGGHATSYSRDNAFWDEGPHVSFTKNPYVKDLLSDSSSSEVLEYPTDVGNYYQAHWIPHPAQSNLYALPQPLASKCYEDFFSQQNYKENSKEPCNYQQWLDQAFGKTFSRTFPHAYTRKYWTCDPVNLSIDWVGGRVFRPDVKTITDGYQGKPKEGTHYINSIRYPSIGGFDAFFHGLKNEANVINDKVVSVDLARRRITLLSGLVYDYEKLISTLPLDLFVSLIDGVPDFVQEASSMLRCSSLLLINILGTQAQHNPYHWLYVYDEDKYSTRITQTHLLSSSNTPDGVAGLQVEVYASPYRPFPEAHDQIARKVCNEILEMHLLKEVHSMHTNYVPYANVIYDQNRREVQDIILTYLQQFGLVREKDDLEPMTDWNDAHVFEDIPALLLAGRFGQWKYFWSDDCLLRGQQISDVLN
jgi:protoporphyrinogen oxidase